MILRSVNVGTAVAQPYKGRLETTAFRKQPVAGPLYLGTLGLPGDEQVYHGHGGPDKAALLYDVAHYPYWREFLGRDPGPAALGETLTVDGLAEADAHIGDVYRVGEALVQVAQPRVPCHKINLVHGVDNMQQEVARTGWGGFYVRVLEPGHVAAGNGLTLVSRPERAPTIAYLNRIMHHEPDNRDAIRRLVDAPALAEQWVTWLRKRLG